MFPTIRLLLAIFLILLITPQTQKSNLVLRLFHDSGLFIDYGEAESFVKFLTRFTICIFLLISLI